MLTGRLPRAPRLALTLVTACVSAAAGAAGVTLRAGPPQQPPPKQPTFRAEANYVRVDVIAMRDGTPVLDLTQDDFELLEDRKLQAITAFEHVVVRPAGAQTSRIEPNTVRESREMAANPRARTFVLFLDPSHVTVSASHLVQGPVVRMLDRIIGQDDLVGVMTPEMSAADISLARKTDTLEGMFTKHWAWGERFSIVTRDPVERQYEECYPDGPGSPSAGIAFEMIARRREKIVLDALADLVRHLQTLRDERKAILVFSEGWTLFRANDRLSRQLQGYPVPGGPEIFVGPTGKIGTQNPRTAEYASLYKCDTDRMHLASIDSQHDFRRLLDDANRGNVTFYPIDPRGLPAFDTPISERKVVGPDGTVVPAGSVVLDAAVLKGRLESLHTLASATDGVAVLNSNDLDRGLKRVSDDLSSYYLLGYYSTNTRLDGSYRTITVKVKRPGVDLRARRGYRAATVEEITAAAPAPEVPADPESATVKRAVNGLAAIRTDLPLRMTAAIDRVSRPDQTLVWVTGELDQRIAATTAWRGGGSATVLLVAGGETLAQGKAGIEPGGRTFLLAIPATIGQGDYRLQVRATPAGGGDAIADGVGLDVPAASARSVVAAPLLLRRGPATAQAFRPTADLRFRRNETIRIEAPVAGESTDASAVLLGRDGQPMRVPVLVERLERGAAPADAAAPARTGSWLGAQVALAPLAPGDYALAIGARAGDTMERVVLAFRVVP